ncbi:hypothetical protein [uncultured Cohaesibacter sp.]|uniref:hypothetical protein n=1 Tax=uncultured Cohaesibacter sp. TaxID=1002546 RepID=UPI0029C823A7|nr:hypothetical protein [uncultured Cohaesibacter sp.]
MELQPQECATAAFYLKLNEQLIGFDLEAARRSGDQQAAKRFAEHRESLTKVIAVLEKEATQ